MEYREYSANKEDAGADICGGHAAVSLRGHSKEIKQKKNSQDKVSTCMPRPWNDRSEATLPCRGPA